MSRLFPLALLFLAACTHLQTRLPTGLVPEAFWKDQAERVLATSQISGKLTVRYQGKKESVSGHGRIVAQMPEHFRLELRDPLGRVQFQLTLAGKNLVAYYPTRKLAYADASYGREYMKQFMGMDVSMKDLEELFVGIVPSSLIQKKAFASWDWDPAVGYYKGVIASTGLRGKPRKLTALVDGQTGALHALEIESADGPLKVAYDDFDSCCGRDGKISIADTISIQMDQTQTSVEVEWQDIEPLEQSPEAGLFQTNFPDGVHVMVLEHTLR